MESLSINFLKKEAAIYFFILSYLIFSDKRKLDIWDKVFKGGLSKFCGRQPLKNLKGWSA